MSTPQDVALDDVRKGIAMFRKVDVPVSPLFFFLLFFVGANGFTHPPNERTNEPRSRAFAVAVAVVAEQITGLLLNQSYFLCPSCATPHHVFGALDGFRDTAMRLGIDVLGELPLVRGVSASGDSGVPYALLSDRDDARKGGGEGEGESASTNGGGGDGRGGDEWKKTMDDVAAKVWNALFRE